MYKQKGSGSLRRMHILILWAILSLSPGLLAQENIAQRCGSAMADLADQGQFSGVVLVARNGEVLYEQAFGMADREQGIANTTDTRFNICSMGKMLTGVAMMRLVQEGKVKLTDTVDRFVPELKKEIASRIQIRHLLSHTSGLGNYMGHPRFASLNQRDHGITDKLSLIAEESLAFEPGARFSYSNSGMIVAGAVIEKVTGMRYEDYIKQTILAPLGMKNTQFSTDGIAIPYVPEGDGFRRGPFIPRPSADGGVATTVGDLLKFDTALHAHQLLDAEHTQQLFSPVQNNYGLGFMNWTVTGGWTAVGHTGGIPGASTKLTHVLEDGTAILVFANLDRAALAASSKLEAAIYP